MNKLYILLLIVIIPFLSDAQSFFTTPIATFIEKPSEKIIDLSFNNTPVDSLQLAINNTRLKYPNNIIRLTVSGSLLIKNMPITLSSKMLLVMNYANVLADNNTTATSLIAVPNDTMVSIFAAGTAILDGGNHTIIGINATTSGKIHIDGLTIQNCKKGGVYYVGRGANVYADAGSVTRCTIANCGAVGISFNNAFNFVCTDNSIKNTTLGIHVNGNYAAITNNTIIKCTTGLESVSQFEAITFNTVDSCTTGINLTTASTETLVSYNKIRSNTIGLLINSTKDRIYYNDCKNTANVAGSGSNNYLFGNLGVNKIDGSNSGCIYFNPPTIGNQHNNVVKFGMGRQDITIKDTSLKSVRSIVDKFHNLYPTDVLVIHLNGTFITTSASDSLLVLDDECYLLNGTINGKDSCGTVLYFGGGITSSFSGGTIDCNGIDGKNAALFITGTANVILDSITLLNTASQGITKRNSFSPTYIRACTINNCNGRCIWEVAGSRLFAVGNTVLNGVKDGIDLDAFSSNSVLMNNYASGNQRNGVFIEEGANLHIVQGNTLTGNTYIGIQFYNLEVGNQYSSKCLVAENVCTNNNRGISVSALSADRATIDNNIFNNVCTNNTDVGIGGFYNGTTAYNNYTALNLLQNNTNGSFYSKANFTNNYVWNMLANPKLLPINFISFNGKEVGNAIQLNWGIATTENIGLYQIERSNDGMSFYKIGEVASSVKDTYVYLDTNPFIGDNYYRIKAIRIDGKVTYSTIEGCTFKPTNDIKVKCFQPTNQLLTVEIVSKDVFERVGVELYDLKGKRICGAEYINLHSLQFSKTIQLPSFSKGVYILSVKTDKGSVAKEVILK